MLCLRLFNLTSKYQTFQQISALPQLMKTPLPAKHLLEPHPFDIDPILLEEPALETSAKFWRQNAQSILRQHLHRQPNTNVAKNVIFFLGDGMSMPTVVAARTLFGQLQGKSGEESQLSFEQFPYVGLSKVS